MRIKGLDYIRLLGIFLVVFYHLFTSFIPGGFLGVNVLFVLSGFLISFHLLDEIYGGDDIDLKKFYYILRANGEIMNNPDKYYMKPPTEEDKKGIKK